MLLFLLITLSTSSVYSLFTNETTTITSFPNITPRGYVYSSHNYTVYTDFSNDMSLGANVLIYGEKTPYSFYLKDPSHITIISPSLFKSFSIWRLELSSKILNLYPKSGAMSLALVLGNRHFLDQNFMDYIRFAGLSHIFALSGLHLIIAIGMVLWVFNILGVRQRYLGVVSLPFSIIYLFIGGFSIPLQRAVLFHLIGAVYQFFRIPSTGKNIFFISFILNLFIIPSNANTVSFWLSYLSVLGIVFYYKFWYDILIGCVGKYLGSLLSISLSVSLLITPLLIWVFGYINIWSIIINLIIVPFIPILLMICFLSVLLSIFNISSFMIDLIIEGFYNCIKYLAQNFSEIPYGIVFIESKITGTGIAIIILLITSIIIYRKNTNEYVE